MATNSTTSGARKPSTRKTTRPRRTSATRRSASSSSTSTQPRTPVEQAQQYAARAFLVPVGAGLIVRDNLVSTVKGFTTKYRTRVGFERELKRYERRGVSARNHLERQARRTRTRFERELRQRRSRVERSVRQNRRRFEKEVRSVRRDLERQSGVVSARFEKLVSDAQQRLSSAA